MTLLDIINELEQKATRFGFREEEIKPIRHLVLEASKEYHERHPINYRSVCVTQIEELNSQAQDHAHAKGIEYIRKTIDEVQNDGFR
jgi:hypothetical protein